MTGARGAVHGGGVVDGQGAGRGRELALFLAANAGGLVIALGCLWASHYVLDLTSPWADNVSGNVVGDLVLGTLFRFWAYRTFVFPAPAVFPAPTG